MNVLNGCPFHKKELEIKCSLFYLGHSLNIRMSTNVPMILRPKFDRRIDYSYSKKSTTRGVGRQM